MSGADSDGWLDAWRTLIAERAGGRPILELGCGSGRDTGVLAAAGHRVVAIDRDPTAIAQAKSRLPDGEFHCQDLRAPFPVPQGGVGVVIASLSLHYFDWPETVALAARIRAALRSGGVLLCRVNSVNDHHHGASGHPALAENFYLVDGAPKRFFDRAAVETLFAGGWRMLALEEKVIDRYARPKAVWEAVAERTA
jgi:SAM-dependent methyltransferase